MFEHKRNIWAKTFIQRSHHIVESEQKIYYMQFYFLVSWPMKKKVFSHYFPF